MHTSTRNIHCVALDPSFLPYVGDAVVRFSYLYPSVEVVAEGDKITLFADTGVNGEELVRDFRFALYRQKIYEETLPLRRALIEGVMGR